MAGQYDLHLPSCPSRPPKHVIYFRDSITNAVRGVHGFMTLSISKGFIDQVSQYLVDEDVKWIDATKLRIGGLTVESTHLEDIMEVEESVDPPYPYTVFAATLCGHSIPSFHSSPQSEPAKSKRKRQGSAEAPAKAPRTTSSGGNLTPADIASQLGLSPGKVRKALRSLGLAKPYSWTEGDEFDKIKAMVKGAK